jgi:hypothetical protein
VNVAAPTGAIGQPIVEVLLRRPGADGPALRRVALRAGRRNVVFRQPARPARCPRGHPLRSARGCYRLVVRDTRRLRFYEDGRRVLAP